jgi:hypothetical protein
MQLPSYQANRICGTAHCLHGAIAGEIQNYSDWYITVFALEVRVYDPSSSSPKYSAEYLIRLPDPVPPGGSFVFNRETAQRHRVSDWSWQLTRIYGYPAIKMAC